MTTQTNFRRWSGRISLALAMGVSMHAQESQPAEPDKLIQLDGTIEAAEWSSSEKHDLKGGGEIYFMEKGRYLLVGIRGNASGWGHVYLASGDTIHVLHASAALGSVRYVKQPAEEAWTNTGRFSWRLRSAELTEAARAERMAYLEREGWVANNSQMGSGRMLEFIIDMTPFAGSPVHLAVAFASTPASPQFWPHSLGDATLEAQLISGDTPRRLQFRPESWHRLVSE